MKTNKDAMLLIVAVLMVLSTCAGEAKAIGPNMAHPYDYISHAVGGAVAVEIVKPETMLGAIALTGSIGVAKELSDKNFDNMDALTWVVGGVLYQHYRVSVKKQGDGLILGTSIKW